MTRVCSIFSQIVQLIPRLEFESAVHKHGAERHARGFSSWGQFIAMLFCQLGHAQSLREICGGLAASEGKLRHLGLLAAMAQGLPVVAIGRGGIPEVVEDEKNGLLVNSLDPEALAAGLARLLANSEEAHRLGKAARETVQARFFADRMVDATLRLYEQVVAASGYSRSGRHAAL